MYALYPQSGFSPTSGVLLALIGLALLGCSSTSQPSETDGWPESGGADSGSGKTPDGQDSIGGAGGTANGEDGDTPSPILPQPSDDYCNQDVYINGRTDLGIFKTAGCSKVSGSLIIGQNWKGNPLVDLSALATLQEVQGDLLLSHSELVDLSGLSALQKVGGDLVLQYNEELTSLSGLEGLTVLTGDLSITYQLRLSSIGALLSWPSSAVQGELVLNNNTLLSQCAVDAVLSHFSANCAAPSSSNCELNNTGSTSCD